MKITIGLFVYNERKYIKSFLDYYKDLDIVVVDNYSTDGTYEYLKRKGVNVTRCDTKGAFHLPTLQTALAQSLKKANPKWFVYAGADLYYAYDKPIREVIEQTDQEGYNQIGTRVAFMKNTGEKPGLPLQDHYFYGDRHHILNMITKYVPNMKFNGDNLLNGRAKVKTVPGLIVNYGCCKPLEEREETVRRREKAWKMGMYKGWGVHYVAGKAVNWIWDKEKLIYFPDNYEWRYLKKICSPGLEVEFFKPPPRLKMKRGVALRLEFGTGRITRATCTDEMAKQLLEKYPHYINYFEYAD